MRSPPHLGSPRQSSARPLRYSGFNTSIWSRTPHSPGSARTGGLEIRTSSQVPFLVKRGLCDLFDLSPDLVRVVCGRVGGGFGGKQEMLTEDIVALAALRTGRPVLLELTREEEFCATTTRHPMTISVTVGADAQGQLMAMDIEALVDAGAYGNHTPSVLLHALSEPIAIYRCEAKRIRGRAAYTTTLPAGAFRGYGLTQTSFAIESAMDELARRSNLDPVAFRLLNFAQPGDCLLSANTTPRRQPDDALAQCLQMAHEALSRLPRPLTDDVWSIGEGIAAAMLDTFEPRGHIGAASIRRSPDGQIALRVGTAEFGSGTATAHAQIAAEILGVPLASISVERSDTDLVAHDTGAFGSTGITVAGRATAAAARGLANRLAAHDACLDAVVEHEAIFSAPDAIGSQCAGISNRDPSLDR